MSYWKKKNYHHKRKTYIYIRNLIKFLIVYVNSVKK